MSSPHFLQRHQKLAQVLKQQELDALALNPGPSLPYLTGMHFHMSERPVVVIFSADQDPIIVLPQLEALKIQNLPYKIQAFPYDENPSNWVKAFRGAIEAGGFEKGRVGVEPRAFRVLELDFLKEAAPEAQFVSGEAAVAELRMRKDASEVSNMREAAQIAQSALQATLPMIKPGVTEKEIATELIMQLLRHGSHSKVPFSPIVSGGPNSANPHAAPSDRKLENGDLLVIDWGANVKGYFSDITRTFAIGEVDPELKLIAEIVMKANATGHATAKPGIPAGQVDDATRAVIDEAGYGEFFTHRTGHGLGLEGHEEPYIRSDNQILLEVGMSFTIEPGIYLPGRGGVRIEDDVVVTADGLESFTDLPRELIQLEA
ncbi:MAG: aminopeptidase P family protein [Anaerolineales bacterium]|nr:aminopeptidase P family protein [Chloroflexota bacterium]MBL6980481.1 aminopeptidase P family protein [Anaerolineales bacterium]